MRPIGIAAPPSRGKPKAQYNLGVSYSNGEGVPQDDAEAVEWYHRAAEQGLAEAQYNLGVSYRNGGAFRRMMRRRPIGIAAPLSRGTPKRKSISAYCIAKARAFSGMMRRRRSGIAAPLSRGTPKRNTILACHIEMARAFRRMMRRQ